MSVGEFCNRDVIVTGKDTTLVEAAQLMRQFHVGDLVIIEEREGRNIPIGILTDRDMVIQVIANEVPLESLKVEDVMSFELVTAEESEGLWDSLRRMRAKGVRRMPVVDAAGALVGIITVDDLLELLAGELRDLAAVCSREQELEQARRP